jgi:hypothetical protein
LERSPIITSKWGKAVAHLAAESRSLPPGFKDWDLMDEEGWTVAHEAAQSGDLPPDFDQWMLTDNCGYTVADVAHENDNLPENLFYLLSAKNQ